MTPKRIWLAMLLLLVATTAGAASATLSGNWVRWLPGDLPLAGYFTLHNDSDHMLRLTGASAPDFGKATLHKSVEKDGQAKMLHVDAIKIPAGDSITFEPGGYHVMLMQRKHDIEQGGKLPITLEFADGSKLTASFPVKSSSGE